jgi:HK97 gp10 family phage protein
MVVKVLNLDKCLRKFGDISRVDLSKPIMEGVRRIQADAKRLAPVDTGYLRESIHVMPLGFSGYRFGGKVYDTVEYAPHQEYGTVKMRARPFMRPAYNRQRKWIIERCKSVLKSHSKKNV